MSVLLKNYHKDVYLVKYQIDALVYNQVQSNDLLNVHMVKIHIRILPYQHIDFNEQMAFPLLYLHWLIFDSIHNLLLLRTLLYHKVLTYLLHHNTFNLSQSCMHLFLAKDLPYWTWNYLTKIFVIQMLNCLVLRVN